MDELVGKILDGVTQDLQCMTRFRAYPSFVFPWHLFI